jgi:SAM-dependent methyltransferase
MSKVQVAEGYYSGDYVSLERLISYSYQLTYLQSVQPGSILFVGLGDGMVTDHLKKNPRYAVTTVDIDALLKPDVIADIKELPFPDGSFDVVCAFEVLEHMPFEDTERAIAELARVSKQHVLVSVPHRRTGLDVVVKFPFIRTLVKRDFLHLSLLVPIRFPGFAVSGQHYWEIDGWTTPLSKVRRALRKHFDIIEELTPPIDYYHRFFKVRKRH